MGFDFGEAVAMSWSMSMASEWPWSLASSKREMTECHRDEPRPDNLSSTASLVADRNGRRA